MFFSCQVGRIKIESRPLILVEAETSAGDVISVLLQYAETVKLVGPYYDQVPTSTSKKWRAISVSSLQPGDVVFALVQNSLSGPEAKANRLGRHMGMKIEEYCLER
jgi:3-dehydroquinate synthase class II